MSIKENLRDPCAHRNDGNALYLDCFNVNILVVILYYGFVRYWHWEGTE